ncbi:MULTISPECIES: vitamin K epoxide reductase family protein [Streptomyces]|uniref:vitamin K epoxide reductase family protein n=1 Tax=Streptomyces TaxID=1883 RepID=UPI0021B4BCC2|nr:MULTISPECIES: vitamin K epoxide reductase family protein [Streptomyces]MCT7350708.1 vitamin K epoxide reductase family protein [Streptomyces sp. 15-116A]MCX4624497.1 vitamin K epoxide reductase family protein [Streptomyces viridodiastaticus]
MSVTVASARSQAGGVEGTGAVGQRMLAVVLTVGGAVGFLAAFTLAVEKIALLKDPSYSPSCSINPVLSCGSVMTTPQAEVFGFPNPLLGIAGFAVVTALGMVLLTGAVLPRWFWWGLEAAVVFGVVFVHWLIFQSLYRIGALCPYCMVVWTVMIPVFWYTTVHILTRGYLPVPDRVRQWATAAAGYHGVVLTAWYVLIAVLILERFWLYWTTLV